MSLQINTNNSSVTLQERKVNTVKSDFLSNLLLGLRAYSDISISKEDELLFKNTNSVLKDTGKSLFVIGIDSSGDFVFEGIGEGVPDGETISKVVSSVYKSVIPSLPDYAKEDLALRNMLVVGYIIQELNLKVDAIITFFSSVYLWSDVAQSTLEEGAINSNDGEYILVT